MSDPLTNLEIQDVLSSIRRLVSEDNRNKPQEKTDRAEEGAAKQPAPAPESKLVLTDALRVPEEEIAAGADVPQGEDTLRQNVAGDGVFDADGHLPEADVPLPDGDALLRDWDTDSAAEAADAQSLEDTIAELEAAVAGIGGEFEPDGSEVAKGTRPDAALEDAFEDGFAVDEAAEEDSAELAQPVTSGEVRGRAEPSADAEQGSDAAEDAEGEGSDETAAAFDDVAGADAEEIAADADSDDGEVLARSGIGDAEEDGVDTGDSEDLAAGEDAADEGETGEVVASEDGASEDGASEDETGEDGDGAGPVPAFIHGGALRAAQPGAESGGANGAPARRLTLTAADAVPGGAARWERDDAPELETLIHDAPEAGAEDGADGEDEVGLFSAGDEAVIDMDMLRDLVAEIIREELQGPLGERITRNVRMLVRREINRALESRNLD